MATHHRISHHNIIFRRTSQFDLDNMSLHFINAKDFDPCLARRSFAFHPGLHPHHYSQFIPTNNSSPLAPAGGGFNAFSRRPSSCSKVFARHGNFNFHLLLTQHAFGAGEYYSRICCIQSPPWHVVTLLHSAVITDGPGPPGRDITAGPGRRSSCSYIRNII